ncbi:MAG: sulfatase-like hydrolase/transferase [Verrucomicrobiae bacterium]|nr:sulfatase-like hydrolase/transferase [Verrucomicrobiae bacterium]
MKVINLWPLWTTLLMATPSIVPGQEQLPNVVILYTDDQATLDIHAFGASDLHTPNMDRLAMEGIRFTQAYAHTVCCPSRAALLTGRHPQRTGVGEWTQVNPQVPKGANMKLSEVTLAEAFQTAGYRTALFGKWHLGADLGHGPEQQGFDEFFGFRGGFIENHIHYFLHGDGFHDLWDGAKEIWRKGEYFPEMITDRSLTFIRENRDRPFFLYLAFNSPHYPMDAREEDYALYENMKEPRRAYAAFVTTTDYYVGQILDELKELGLAENTIVILQSDNGHEVTSHQSIGPNHSSGLPEGYNYGPHGGGGYTGKWIGHKYDFYEGGIRTPAILRYPARITGGQVRTQAVTVMDWYPTLMDLCGLSLPRVEMDGKSLVPLILDGSVPSPHERLYYQWYYSWMVREGEWKLYFRVESGQPESTGKLLLLNLSDQEPERINYLDRYPEKATRLRKYYEAWKADLGE